MKILLDSHALVWLAAGDERLGSKFTRLLGDRASEIYVSIASLWELSIKVSLGKLTLPAAPEDIADAYDIDIVAIDPRHLARLRLLPHLHGDPFDRILIAQSLEERMTLATSDRNIRRYQVPVIW